MMVVELTVASKLSPDVSLTVWSPVSTSECQCIQLGTKFTSRALLLENVCVFSHCVCALYSVAIFFSICFSFARGISHDSLINYTSIMNCSYAYVSSPCIGVC